MEPCVLRDALTKAQQEAGYTLQEESDDFLYLFHKGKRVAGFSQRIKLVDLWRAVDELMYGDSHD